MTNNKILDQVRLIQKCIILDDKGRILALRRAPVDHSRGGNWDLPGGGYEQGEDVLEAIKREVQEEVGLILRNPIPVYFTGKIDVKQGFFQGNTVFGMCYTCSGWSGVVVLSREHVEHRWVTPEEFKSFNFGADSGFFAEAIQAFLDKRIFTS